MKLLVRAEEQYAEGNYSDDQLYEAFRKVGWYDDEEEHVVRDHYNWARGYAYDLAKDATDLIEIGNKLEDENDEERWSTTFEKIESAQCDLARDIFGNPFREPLPFLDVPFAHVIYDKHVEPDGTFPRAAMQKLVKILEHELGSKSTVVSHIKGSQQHVRGCWVVDFLTGRR